MSSSSLDLRYLNGKGETFAGNFSFEERRSFFDHTDDRVLVPCGFLRDFSVRESDRAAMEDRATVFSGDLPYDNPTMNGVIPKHLIHRLFPNAKFSIWIDAKLKLTADPLLLLHAMIVSKNADMAVSKHPFNIHTMEEAMATARWGKWGDIKALRTQMETYCDNGLNPWSPEKLPYTTDVPDTAIIARRHGARSNLFSCLLFNELEGFNPRDQLAFAYVRDMMNPRIRINMFEVEVFEQVAMEFRHNLKQEGRFPAVEGRGAAADIKGSKCENYLLKMWGDVND